MYNIKDRGIERLTSLGMYKKKLIDTKLKDLEVNQLALFVCSENIYDDFIFYEGEREQSVGIGVAVLVTVYPDRINLKNNQEELSLPIEDINQDLKNIFSIFEIKKWRLYGVSDFNFSNYTHHRETVSKDDVLIQMFMPKIDLRLSQSSVQISAFKQEDIARVENCIKCFQVSPIDVCEAEKNIDKIKDKDSIYYQTIVSKAVEEITADQYQKVILSRKIYLDQRIDMEKSYLLGRKHNTPARSYYVKLLGDEVIGYSPETVVEVDSDKTVYTFPLAGTRAMSQDTVENERLRRELYSDPKEVAEHAVSVKLAYEELEAVCEQGSVSVIQFMDVLKRGTVQHLASRLKGKIKENMNEWHAFSALFPAVTASGIPKKESIDAIRRLEKEARGLYSGGVFTYDSDSTLDVALVLRSAYQTPEKSWIRAGAGIVKLSNPDRELEETKEKLSSVVNQIVYAKN